jgi:hypothetical protein
VEAFVRRWPSLCLVFVAGLASAAAQKQMAPQRPGAEHALGFYDAKLGRVVLVGGPGDPAEGERDRVWSWGGTRWELVGETGPSSRVNAAAAYDTVSGTAIVSGGARKTAQGSWEVLGDAWERGPRGWRPAVGMEPRDHHAMVDDGTGALLLFGGIGSDRAAAWPGDTWAWRGGQWTRVTTTGPPPRARTALAYDSRRRQVVLFGGVTPPGPDNTQVFLGDTWIFEGGRWRSVPQVDGPRGRYAHAMVFDERAGLVLLYGGSGAHSGAPLADMWSWNGVRWTAVPLKGPTPGHRYQPVMIHDRARGRTVLYGTLERFRDDTWEWDGSRWFEIERADAAAAPARR